MKLPFPFQSAENLFERTLRLRLIAATFGLCGATLLFTGCGNAAQQHAYERAAHSEQRYTVESAAAIVEEYRQVIALQPRSALAKQAATRIDAVETRLKAEELHKSVFQEHGVD